MRWLKLLRRDSDFVLGGRGVSIFGTAGTSIGGGGGAEGGGGGGRIEGTGGAAIWACALSAPARQATKAMRKIFCIGPRISFLRCVLDRIETVGFQSKQIPRLQHVGRQGRGGVDHAAAGMRNNDPPRQKMQAILQPTR